MYTSHYIPLLISRTRIFVMNFSSSRTSPPFMEPEGSDTFYAMFTEPCGLASVVGVATGYGLDDPGIESRWEGEIFRTCPDRPWGPPNLLYIGYRVFPGGKERPGRDADPTSPSGAVVMKGYSYTSTPPIGRTACTAPQYLYKGDLYLFFTRSQKPAFAYPRVLTWF
jgi:hypothetical protein